MPHTITRIERATLTGTRPREVGSNARLGHHGGTVTLPIVRLTTSDGATGFGRSTADESTLAPLLGQPIDALVIDGAVADAAGEAWRAAEFPLLDLAARIAGVPVHALSGSGVSRSPRVRTYDTSLYFDDLHLDSDEAAADLIASEARDGWELGHRAFKLKVGRGAKHMSLEDGTRRDIAVIRAVREATAPDATIMLDANNGWNLNLVKQVLTETADARIYWLEEAFHEDNVLYGDLKEWLAGEGLPVLIADGEGVPHPAVATWALDGLIDVVQHNVHGFGFGAWRDLGSRLDAAGLKTSPHTYGNGIGQHMCAQLSALVSGLEFVEWDEASFDALDMSGYVIADGWVTVPDAPGWGFGLDEGLFAKAVEETGFVIGG